MEAQLNQPKTYGAQDYAQAFFREIPTDSRFLQNTFQKFPPSTSLATKTIEFNLSRFEAANVYQIQDTHLQVTIKITKADGNLPDTTKLVAPCNNVLHSLFEAIRVKVNDDLVAKNPSYYPYKAYITNCLTYDTLYKASQLGSEGYYQDTHTQMETPSGLTNDNTGLEERNNLFRKGHVQTGAYSPQGARFFGRLHIDLSSSTTGLPPGTKVCIELDRSSDDFVIMKRPDDTTVYKVVLMDCNLFVPVAQLSAPLFSEIGSTFSHQSMSIHFRRIEVKTLTLPKDKEEYNSDVLFSEDMPCRIIITFIESKSKTGDQKTNPFNFKRSWEKKTSAIEEEEPASLRERLLEEKLQSLQNKLDRFQSLLDIDNEMLNQIEQFQGRKGTGRGKRSTTQESSSSIFGRLRSSFSSTGML